MTSTQPAGATSPRPDPATALVIGASGALGREIAVELDRLGCAVALHYNCGAEGVKSLEPVLRRPPLIARADITSWDEVRELHATVVGELGHPDVLVNCSGIRRDTLMAVQRPDQWRQVIDVNLIGTFHTCKAVLPRMLKNRWGRIVNVVSPSGLIASPGQTAYSASKAGVIGLTRSLAAECGRRGVTVNALSPGFMETAMTSDVGEGVKDMMKQKLPIPRFGDPSEIAASMRLFLDGDYMTGQVVSIDGGISVT